MCKFLVLENRYNWKNLYFFLQQLINIKTSEAFIIKKKRNLKS